MVRDAFLFGWLSHGSSLRYIFLNVLAFPELSGSANRSYKLNTFTLLSNASLLNHVASRLARPASALLVQIGRSGGVVRISKRPFEFSRYFLTNSLYVF